MARDWRYRYRLVSEVGNIPQYELLLSWHSSGSLGPRTYDYAASNLDLRFKNTTSEIAIVHCVIMHFKELELESWLAVQHTYLHRWPHG